MDDWQYVDHKELWGLQIVLCLIQKKYQSENVSYIQQKEFWGEFDFEAVKAGVDISFKKLVHKWNWWIDWLYFDKECWASFNVFFLNELGIYWRKDFRLAT